LYRSSKICRGKTIAGNNTNPRGNRGIVVSVSIRLILDGAKPGQFVSTLNTIIITEKAW
jgi:ribosomal protein L35AE/L33A